MPHVVKDYTTVTHTDLVSGGLLALDFLIDLVFLFPDAFYHGGTRTPRKAIIE